MPISSALFEELIEDTKRLIHSLVEYAERWGTYGDQLNHLCSDSQRQELEKVLGEFLDAARDLDRYQPKDNK